MMDGRNIRGGDINAFHMFALNVRSLVSMLKQLGQKGKTELECGSHISRLCEANCLMTLELGLKGTHIIHYWTSQNGLSMSSKYRRDTLSTAHKCS